MSNFSYTESAYELGIGQKSVEELGKDFATLGEVAKDILLTPAQQKTLDVLHEAAETLIINPIKNNSRVVQNTLEYYTL